MNVLITGGAGFIGSNLALELEKQGYSVIIIDNLISGDLNNLNDFKGKFIEMDTSNLDLDENFDAIFHQAAITDPRHGDDKETYEKNVEGFKNIIKLAKKNNAKLIYASTANLYGNGPVPMAEDQQKEIISTYGKSKLKMDEIAKTYFNKMHIVGLRYFNVFGPRESYKGRSASMVFHLRNQMNEDKKPRLFKYGKQIRDHIYIKDVVRANILALESPCGIYNVGTGKGTSFNEIVRILNQVLKKNLEIEYFDNPYDIKTYQKNTKADTTKAEKFLKFKAKYSVKDSVKDYDIFLRENK